MILFSGGKTAGHVIPLINIIKKYNIDSLYLGLKGEIEEKLCNDNNIKFIQMKYKDNKLDNYYKNYKDIKTILNKYNIKLIFISGGYVSIPSILYGINNSIKIYSLEENSKLGLVNIIFYPFINKIFTTFNILPNNKKITYIDMPINYNVDTSYEKYDILIIGGSLGSRVLCDLVDIIDKKYNICLIASNYYDEYKNKYKNVYKFRSDIKSLMKSTKIIISRAGAMTLFEGLNLNSLMIVIPSENTKRNHQVYNAKYFSELGLIKLLRENQISNINDVIKELLDNEIIYKSKIKDFIINNRKKEFDFNCLKNM